MVENNITKNTFRFIKYRCIHCREIILHNKLFCNKECRDLYFEKKDKMKYGTWTNKNKRRIDLSDLLSEESLKAMVKDTEKNIDEQMNKSKR